MAKHDWQKLKRLFISGDCKTLREFAEVQDIPYRGLRANAVGWVTEKRAKQEQKQSKITNTVLERQAEYEIDRNTAHLAAGDLILAKLNIAIAKIKPMDTNAVYLLSTAASALEKVQKSQRLGDGNSNSNEVTIIDDL